MHEQNGIGYGLQVLELHKPVALVFASVFIEWNVNTGEGASLEWNVNTGEGASLEWNTLISTAKKVQV